MPNADESPIKTFTTDAKNQKILINYNYSMKYTSEPQLISMNYYENYEKKNENDRKIIIIIFKWDIIFIQSILRPYHHQQ